MWGYDNNFMEACRGELTIEPCDLRLTSIAVAEKDHEIVGVAQSGRVLTRGVHCPDAFRRLIWLNWLIWLKETIAEDAALVSGHKVCLLLCK